MDRVYKKGHLSYMEDVDYLEDKSYAVEENKAISQEVESYKK